MSIDRTDRIARVRLLRPPVLLALTALAMAVSAPLGAQQGRNLLAREEPLQIRSEQVFLLKESAGDVVVYEAGELSLVEAPTSEPTGIPSAATTEYKYDDGTFESYGFLETSSGPVYEQEFAERFRLTQSGKASYVTVCVVRDRDRGTSSQLPFTLNFYRDSGGAPAGITDLSRRGAR